MISYIEGKVILKKEKYIVVFASGIGYKVFLSKKNMLNIEEKKNISLFCFLDVKENSLNLYGFLSKEELDFFERLATIRGIGPKASLEISSIGDMNSLKERIIKQDETLLYGISGIGKKKAMAILFELGEKIKREDNGKEEELFNSLVNLGFSRPDVKKVILETDFLNKTIEEKIKITLKKLSGK